MMIDRLISLESSLHSPQLLNKTLKFGLTAVQGRLDVLDEFFLQWRWAFVLVIEQAKRDLRQISLEPEHPYRAVADQWQNGQRRQNRQPVGRFDEFQQSARRVAVQGIFHAGYTKPVSDASMVRNRTL